MTSMSIGDEPSPAFGNCNATQVSVNMTFPRFVKRALSYRRCKVIKIGSTNVDRTLANWESCPGDLSLKIDTNE